MKNIAIIGGGACGTAVLVELLLQIACKEWRKDVKITLIEKEKQIGYGLAFGTDQPGHLLNTQAYLMGIHSNEPGHFAEWVKKKKGISNKKEMGTGFAEQTYTTRKLYGEYVSENASRYLQIAKDLGVHIELIHEEAIDIDKGNNFYEVICKSGLRIPTDYIVLAPGTPKPTNYQELLQYPQYIDSPWPSENILKQTLPDDHIGVFGSSLSAIDVAITLIDNGHTGPISFFSPDGMLPRVHPESERPYTRKFLTRENIHRKKRETFKDISIIDLYRMFQDEVEDYAGEPVDWKSLDRTGKPADNLLEYDIHCAENGGDELMTVVFSLREDASPIWSLLGVAEKQRFKKLMGAHWMVNQHAMPLQNAYRLRKLFQKGVLKVLPYFQEVSFDENSKKFLMKHGSSKVIPVDKLINSTGCSSHLEQMNSSLINNMLKKSFLTPYPLGGAVINERTMKLVSPQGGERIYALGHIVNGMLLDVNAVWFNVRTADIICKDILFNIRDRNFS
jgi:uncharacterized NAD(P)/FAD-binding protein YdhS